MSTKGYEIPITVPGIKESLAAFDQIAEKMKETGRVSREVRTQQQSSRGNVFDRVDHLNNFSGPFASANDQRWHDVQRVRAQRQADRANRDLSGPADPMKTMFMRTRLKIGNYHPLIGDLVKNGLMDEGKMDSMMTRLAGSSVAKSVAASLAGGAMPLLLAGAGAAAAVAGGVALVEGFAGSQRGLSSAYWSGGGSRNMGSAVGVGGFNGMSPGETGQLANQFGDRLRAGGYGASVMRSNGIVDFGRYTLNKFDNLTKAMDLLRKMDEKQAIMVARDLGISDMLSVRDLSPEAYQRLKNSGAMGTSEGARKQEAEYRAGKEVIGNYWGAGVRLVGSDLMDKIFHPWKAIPGIGPMIDIGMQAWNGLTGGKNGSSGNAQAENTEAIKNMTRTMKDHAEFIGGGSRARGAMPVGAKGSQFENNADGYSQMLGAFSI